MKIYEIVTSGGIFVDAVKQGRYFRQWSVTANQPLPTIWLQSECEVLPPITEEFLPLYTNVYTSHGNWGWIIKSQYRDNKGELHPAQVFILNADNPLHCKVVPIWENQLVKAIK